MFEKDPRVIILTIILCSQVAGAGDGGECNHHVVPQQDCPTFSGDCVLSGAFKKISNSVIFYTHHIIDQKYFRASLENIL